MQQGETIVEFTLKVKIQLYSIDTFHQKYFGYIIKFFKVERVCIYCKLMGNF